MGAGPWHHLRAGDVVRAPRIHWPLQRSRFAKAAAVIALAIEDIAKNFGGVCALQGVTLSLEAGQRLVLLGPNGAGKTTLFHTISGNIVPSSGRISLFGENITQ